MSVTPETTPKQFAAALSEAMAGMTPAESPQLSTTQFLARHRRTLQRYAAKGFTPEQIAEGLRHPGIGIDVGVMTVKRALSKAKKRKAPIRYTAAIPLTFPPGTGS